MNNKRTLILLAFRNDDDIRTLSGYFSGLGFGVSTVKDGARALELAIELVPSIIIADTELPVISGEKMFQILRNNPHTSTIPFVFISRGISDIKGFRTGVDIFLLRPINMEELYGRVRQSLLARGPEAAESSKEIEGNLSHMSLPDILQFLHLNNKEGELRITSGGSCGRVFVKGGQIFNAMLDGVEKEKALFRLLQWNDGKFEFAPKTVSITKKITASSGNLLMEGMRQMDEFRKRQDQFPDRNSLIKPRIKPEALPKGLLPVVYEIMELLKTYPKVEELVEHSAFTDLDVYQTLASMVAKGLIEAHKPEALKDHAEFLTQDQMISIREKIMSRFADASDLNSANIFLLSNSGDAVNSFVRQCLSIPGFSSVRKTSGPYASAEPLGTVARFRLYGGMDLNIFSVPSVKNMGPICKAFSRNIIGLILLWDHAGGKDLKDLSGARKEILSQRRVPVSYICAGKGAGAEDMSSYRQTLNLRPDEPLFKLTPGEDGMIFEILYSLFGSLIKDDYAGAAQRRKEA